MGYIKKDVNFGLLFIIILLAVAVASIGVYYNENYSSLSERYQQQVNELQKATQDLLFHKSRLNKTTTDLATKEQDESELGQKYAKLRDDKETLERENNNLKIEIETTKSELEAQTNELLQAQVEITALRSQAENLKQQVSLLEVTKASLRNKLETVCAGDRGPCD